MRKLLVFSVIVVLSAVSVLAQETERPLFEPASGTFYLDLGDLNALLRASDFAPLATPVFLAGGWTRLRTVDWLPLGLTIAEGAVGSERGPKRAQLTLFYFSLLTDYRRALSELVPNLQGFVSAGLGVGTATLFLGQRAADERTLEAAMQNPHDTLLRRLFLALVPRAGIEFSIDVITARISLGYSWSFWSSAWEHFAKRLSGPPKSFDGFLIEFTFAYAPPKRESKND